MHSRLYQGQVWHARREPAYVFRYGVFYFDLDLAEIDSVAARLGLFRHNRPGLLSLYDRDYLALNNSETLVCPDADCDGWRIGLLTLPRLAGYAFNPVSFFLWRDASGSVRHVLAEVHNTWDEKHLYHLGRQSSEGEPYRSGTKKRFYVSPFLDVRGGYRFELNEDAGGRLRIEIREDSGAGEVFVAGLDLRPLPLSRGNVCKLLLRFPLLNLKTIAAIHWQGLKLWLRGERFRGHAGWRERQGSARAAP